MGHRRLAHAIDRLGRQRHEARLRAEAHDPPVSLLDHDPTGRLAGEEDALHVHIEGEVEVLLDHVLGGRTRAEPRVVHEDVEPPKGPPHLLDGGRDLLQPTHVHGHGRRPPAHGPDLVDQALGAPRLAESERHVRSGMGERQRDCATDASRRAGDERRLALEIEPRKFHGLGRCRRHLGDHEGPPSCGDRLVVSARDQTPMLRSGPRSPMHDRGRARLSAGWQSGGSTASLCCAARQWGRHARQRSTSQEMRP